MPRIPTRVLTSSPVGTANPAVATTRSLAPANIRTLGPALPRQQFRDFRQNRQQSAVTQALGQSKARYDADHQLIPGVTIPVSLARTVTVTNGSPTLTWAVAQTLTAGTLLTFSAQPGVVYQLAAAVVASTSGTLTANFTGTNSSTSSSAPLTIVQHRLGRAFVGCLLVNPRNAFLSYQVCHNTDPRLDASQVLIANSNRLIAVSVSGTFDQTPLIADVVVY